MNNYGELFYEQYLTFLGQPIDREVYRNNASMPSIQVLKFENVFEECLVYTTLGLSNYGEIIESNIEVILVTDAGFKSTGYLLANSLFYCLAHDIKIGRGVAISGIENLDIDFVEKYNKTALYFTDVIALPDEFDQFQSADKKEQGQIVMAFFISQNEYNYFEQYGAEQFEDLLEEKQIDPFHIARESII